MEHGNHGSGMRDHSDFSEFEQVPFMELLYSPPSVDDVEHHHNSFGSSWGPPASNYNFSHQKSSLNQFISPIPIPSSYAAAYNYAPLNHLSSIPPPVQNQFNFEAKLNLSPIENLTVEKPADDGYNWRKYGQKQLKDGKYPKSYYKCTNPSCPVKKTIERSSEGNITDITYQGQHNHGAVRQIESCENGEEEIVVSKSDQERMSGSVDSDGLGNSEVIIDSADSEIDKHSKDDISGSSSSGNKKKEQKIIFEMRSEVDLIDDGFRWRKYGQKSVKGNPHPRSYYKCTHLHCNVRKQIERASRDPKIVLTTYEGKHTHDPAPSSARAISSHDTIQPTMVSEKTTNRLMNDAREHAMDLQPKQEAFFVT